MTYAWAQVVLVLGLLMKSDMIFAKIRSVVSMQYHSITEKKNTFGGKAGASMSRDYRTKSFSDHTTSDY